MGKFTTNLNLGVVAKPDLDDIKKAGFLDEAISIYKGLGGILTDLPCRIGDWDFLIDGKVVELDEEAHFNRYRAMTLTSSIYKDNQYVDVEKYLSYCKDHEMDCLKGRSFGGYWSNDSTEKQFGKSEPNGNLAGNGSPRWKQRALYDFIKDHVPFISGVPVLRISIYDVLIDENDKSISVNQILETLDQRNAHLLYERIKS